MGVQYLGEVVPNPDPDFLDYLMGIQYVEEVVPNCDPSFRVYLPFLRVVPNLCQDFQADLVFVERAQSLN